MYNKITQLKFIEARITKVLTTISCLLLVGFCFGQTTVVNFEVPSEYQHLGWEGTAEVVSNPNSSGMNTSTNVAKYTTPANKAWGNASVVIINTALAYKDLDNLQFNVIAPSGTQMYAKLELDGVGGVAEAYATTVASADWQLVTFNFSVLGGVDVNTATYDKFVLFFNVNDNVGGEVWHFDNIAVQSNTLSVDDRILTNNSFIHPNPVRDILTFKTSSIFEGGAVSIYNIAGQLIKTTNRVSVNVENLKSGLYIATIENKSGQKITKKFIKN